MNKLNDVWFCYATVFDRGDMQVFWRLCCGGALHYLVIAKWGNSWWRSNVLSFVFVINFVYVLFFWLICSLFLSSYWFLLLVVGFVFALLCTDYLLLFLFDQESSCCLRGLIFSDVYLVNNWLFECPLVCWFYLNLFFSVCSYFVSSCSVSKCCWVSRLRFKL